MPGKFEVGILCLALCVSISLSYGQEPDKSSATDGNKEIVPPAVLSDPPPASIAVEYATYPAEMLVRQMLDIDAALAMRKEKERYDAVMKKKGNDANCQAGGGGTSSSSSESSSTSDEPAKVAVIDSPKIIPMALGIFGMGNALFSDLDIGGERVRFQQGRAHPLGYPGDYPYSLVEIKPPCVIVKNGSETLKTCIKGAH